MTTRAEAILQAQNTLKSYAIPNADNEGRWLAEYICEQSAPEHRADELKSALARRTTHEPLSYILGIAPFFDLDFEVNQHTLIPRSETETLVDLSSEEILKLTASLPVSNSELIIADLGTGTGCIAITLLKRHPNVTAYATDISPEALKIAKKNAHRHGVENRIKFIHGSWMDGIPVKAQIDIVISNPPYVKTTEWPELQNEVKKEPFSALVSGPCGTEAIETIIEQASQHSHIKTVLIEGHYDLKQQLAQHQTLNKLNPEFFQDTNGHQRFIKVKNAKIKIDKTEKDR